MHHVRNGNTLCEVLFALVILSATAAWGLAATAAAERALGTTAAHRASLHRAERALADLDALPCDSAAVTRSLVEPRWQVDARRSAGGAARIAHVSLRSVRRDTVQLHGASWCD